MWSPSPCNCFAPWPLSTRHQTLLQTAEASRGSERPVLGSAMEVSGERMLLLLLIYVQQIGVARGSQNCTGRMILLNVVFPAEAGCRDLKSAVWVGEKERKLVTGDHLNTTSPFEFHRVVRHPDDGGRVCCCRSSQSDSSVAVHDEIERYKRMKSEPFKVCIPATSASSERTFSTTGLIITEKRNQPWFSCTGHGI